MVTIYALVDPRQPGAVRYVGLTAQALTQRVSQHLAAARRRKRGRVQDWLRELIRLGLEPVPVGLETCEEADAPRREQAWIVTLSDQGARLLNVSAGGERGPKPNPVVCWDDPFDWDAVDRDFAARQVVRLRPVPACYRKENRRD